MIPNLYREGRRLIYNGPTGAVTGEPNTPIEWHRFFDNPYSYLDCAVPAKPLRSMFNPDSSNATYIPYGEADPDKYELYKKLDGYNSGKYNLNWENKSYHTFLLNEHLIESLGTQLDLTKEQRRNARARFLSLELDKWGVDARLVAFCVCAYTVHQDDTLRSYHPNQSEDNKDPLFNKIGRDLGFRRKTVTSVYSKLETHFRLQDTEGQLEYDWLYSDSYSRNEVEGVFVPPDIPSIEGFEEL